MLIRFEVTGSTDAEILREAREKAGRFFRTKLDTEISVKVLECEASERLYTDTTGSRIIEWTGYVVAGSQLEMVELYG